MLGISTRTIPYRLKQYAQEREEGAAPATPTPSAPVGNGPES